MIVYISTGKLIRRFPNSCSDVVRFTTRRFLLPDERFTDSRLVSFDGFMVRRSPNRPLPTLSRGIVPEIAPPYPKRAT
jgi:hypothetical protein